MRDLELREVFSWLPHRQHSMGLQGWGEAAIEVSLQSWVPACPVLPGCPGSKRSV